MDDAPHGVAIPYLVESIAFLLTVVVIVPLFKRFKVSPILGYLAIGAAIGPYSLGIVHDVAGVSHVAELGVIFLLFAIGLELSFERLKAFSKLIFGLGAMQVLLSACAIGGIAFFWGNSPEASIIIGLCLALSSTAMVMQVLSERGEMATPAGRAAFAVLLFQDLAVVPILILLSIFGGGMGSSVWVGVGLAFLKGAVAVGTIVLFGRFALRHLFRVASGTRSVDVFTAMMLLTILATSLLTGVAGLSMALGAFLAGLMLAETEFRHQVESEIEPFKGLLLGLFFMSVGMSLDFGLAFQRGVWVVLSVLGLIGIKVIITTACAKTMGVKLPVALRSALLLGEAGEFAFVVIGGALQVELLSPEVGQFMVVVAGLSMALTPALASLAKWVEKRMSGKQDNFDIKEDAAEHMSGHVIIAGFGRVGRAVAAVLKSEAVPYIAMDTSASEVKHQRELHEPVFVGNAARPELLKHAGIEHAAAVLVTMDNAKAAHEALEVIRMHWPQIPVLVRSRDSRHASELLRLGATTVVPETLEASLQLSGHVLVALGYPREDANACIDVIRRHNYAEVHPGTA